MLMVRPSFLRQLRRGQWPAGVPLVKVITVVSRCRTGRLTRLFQVGLDGSSFTLRSPQHCTQSMVMGQRRVSSGVHVIFMG